MKKINKIILATLLSTAPLLAGDDTNHNYYSSSLVGVELGYSNLDLENDDTPSLKQTYKFALGGLKIGAQTDNYRIFLSARQLQISEFDSAYTLGGEFQYLFNFSKYVNAYIGVNAGQAEMKFVDTKNVTRTIADPYYGGDLGMNVHVSDSIDLEFGARVMSLNAKNDKESVIYTFNTISTGYMSLIFKYNMD